MSALQPRTSALGLAVAGALAAHLCPARPREEPASHARRTMAAALQDRLAQRPQRVVTTTTPPPGTLTLAAAAQHPAVGAVLGPRGAAVSVVVKAAVDMLLACPAGQRLVFLLVRHHPRSQLADYALRRAARRSFAGIQLDALSLATGHFLVFAAAAPRILAQLFTCPAPAVGPLCEQFLAGALASVQSTVLALDVLARAQALLPASAAVQHKLLGGLAALVQRASQALPPTVGAAEADEATLARRVMATDPSDDSAVSVAVTTALQPLLLPVAGSLPATVQALLVHPPFVKHLVDMFVAASAVGSGGELACITLAHALALAQAAAVGRPEQCGTFASLFALAKRLGADPNAAPSILGLAAAVVAHRAGLVAKVLLRCLATAVDAFCGRVRCVAELTESDIDSLRLLLASDAAEAGTTLPGLVCDGELQPPVGLLDEAGAVVGAVLSRSDPPADLEEHQATHVAVAQIAAVRFTTAILAKSAQRHGHQVLGWLGCDVAVALEAGAVDALCDGLRQSVGTPIAPAVAAPLLDLLRLLWPRASAANEKAMWRVVRDCGNALHGHAPAVLRGDAALVRFLEQAGHWSAPVRS